MDDNMTITKEISDIFALFYNSAPRSIDIIDTSRGEADFRKVILATLENGERAVIKLSDNDFTLPERIAVWQRTIEEYRTLGYYCPRIYADKSGTFPSVRFEDRTCIAYAEEFSLYKTAFERDGTSADGDINLPVSCSDDAWIMTAKIAAKQLSYCDFPSGYCLFETFCPSDKTYEVLEVAQDWLKTARTFPEEVQPQVEHIWSLWCENRDALEPLYRELPTSVFQADLNSTNILINDEGNFIGVCDFNICGREVFLNYLMREAYQESRPKARLEEIRSKLNIVKEHYSFSEAEMTAAPLIFRCIAPLWYTLEKFSNNTAEISQIKNILDEIEFVLTESIDLSSYMK